MKIQQSGTAVPAVASEKTETGGTPVPPGNGWLCGRCEQIKRGLTVTLPDHTRQCPERFTLVNSSDIASVEYVASREELTIKFHASGAHRYYSVPKPLRDQLVATPRPGKFFLQNIKGKFAWEKVTA